MINNYPQIAVLGCDSNKANLYYDIERKVWVEHLVSSCIKNEQDILEFCQKAYPSLHVGNIVRLDTVLRFTSWCEIIPAVNDNIPRCKTENQIEELVQPFHCLSMNSKHEELTLPNNECTVDRINDKNQCLRAEKWQQLASLSCSNRTMILNNSIMTQDWCGLAKFHGIEYICCPLNVFDTNSVEQATLVDDTLYEDDPIKDLDSVPKTSTIETHRRILALSLGLREPNWMQDSRQWNAMAGYFADDEDMDDEQEEIKLSSARKSHLTINEHERFSKDKEEFRRKYQEQIEQLKLRWQKRQNEIQSIANINPYQAQKRFEDSDIEFRREYVTLKQEANRERTRINELHESNLDKALEIARNETNQKLSAAWNENPLKTENIGDALYDYLHVLLRDRIHLVNRYERLHAVDPEQAERKRVSIHERLRSIANQINDALNQLRHHSIFQDKIQPRIDTLLEEYDEVNRAAEKLVIDYVASLSTTTRPTRLLPLGRDEKNIYPLWKPSNEIDYNYNNNDYYNSNELYDDNYDDYESTKRIENYNDNFNDQTDFTMSDWDVGDDHDVEINVQYDSNDHRVPLMKYKDKINRPIISHSFRTYFPYISGCLLIICIICAVLIIRCLNERRKYRYGNIYETKYNFKQVDSYTPEEKALYALQMNGYENPTYKFFESQTPKC